MNWLQPNFYISFPVTPSAYNIVLLDVCAYRRLAQNAHFLSRLKTLMPDYGHGMEMVGIFKALKEMRSVDVKTSGLDHTLLETLHLNVMANSEVIIPEKNSRPRTYLLTEKFFWRWPTTNLGSSRHALLLDYQIKGVGRNPLVVRNDHHHSWGGMYLWQSVKGYAVGHLLKGVSPLGVLNTTMVSRKPIAGAAKSSDVSLLFRESDATRVTQVTTEFDPAMLITKERVVKDFYERVGSNSAEEHMENIIFHYASLFLLGIRHSAVTRENITLEGPLIDYEDIKFDTDGSQFHFFFILQKCLKKTEAIPYYKGQRLYTSSLHLYLDAIELTAIGLSYLSGFKVKTKNLKSSFLKMLKKLSKEIFDVDAEFLRMISLTLEHEAIYHKGESLELLRGESAHRLQQALKGKNVKELMKEDLGPIENTHHQVSFPRPRLKESFLERHNTEASGDIENLTSDIFKRLQLETHSGEVNFESALNLSSEVNKLLIKKAQCFPYEYKKGEIKKIVKKKAEIEKELQSVCKASGATFVSWIETQDPASKCVLIKGANVRLHSEEHCLILKPALYR